MFFDCHFSVFSAPNYGFCPGSALADVHQDTVPMFSHSSSLLFSYHFSSSYFFSAQFYEMSYCFPHISFLNLLHLCTSFFFSSPCCSFALCLSFTHPPQHLPFYLSSGCSSCLSYLLLILPRRSGSIVQGKDLHKAEASSFSAALRRQELSMS